MSGFTNFFKSFWNSRPFLKGSAWGLLAAAMVVGALFAFALVALAIYYQPNLFASLTQRMHPFACVTKDCINIVHSLPKEYPLP
jgi:drug/metabolite transporter (DMT)-like permease